MAGRSTRKGIPKLSHDAVREHLLDYHFGRLAPALNAAVELHVRSCPICQREGLGHLATQKRAAVRVTRRMRRRRFGTPAMRLFTLLLVVTLLLLLVLISTSRGQRLPWIGSAATIPKIATALTRATAVPTPTVTTLTSSGVFGQASSGAIAAATSQDGKVVAFVTTSTGAVQVATWDAKSRSRLTTLSYSDSAAPGVLAWSPDKSHLAAATGQNVMVWNVATGGQVWSVLLPQVSAVRVYDAQVGLVVQRPDPTTTFAKGAFLQWGQNGQVSPAPATAAGASGVATPDGPLIGIWQVAGSHVFAGTTGHAFVGVSATDRATHVATLTWSPDGRYLLWASLSQPLLVSASAGTPLATVAPSGNAVPTPDPAVEAVAEHVAGRQGDALLWFSPDGRWVAVCDRTAHAESLVVMTRDQGRPLYQVAGVCTNLTASALSWHPDSSGFVLGVPAQPAATYTLPTQT